MPEIKMTYYITKQNDIIAESSNRLRFLEHVAMLKIVGVSSNDVKFLGAKTIYLYDDTGSIKIFFDFYK